MSKIHTTSHIFFITSLLVFILVLGGYIATYITIQAKNENITRIEQEYQQYMDDFNNSTRERRLIESTTKEREELASLFIPQENISRLFEMLEDTAAEFEVNLEVISAREQEGEYLRIQLNTTGSYEAVRSFVVALEEMPIMMNILQTILEEQDQNWQALITLEIINP